MPKIAIIYASFHHGNTKRLVEELAKQCEIDLFEVTKAQEMDVFPYDMIGFASGIYMGKLQDSLSKFLDTHPQLPEKAFVLYTSGSGGRNYAHSFLAQLQQTGVHCLGVYSCKGYDTYGFWKLFGGISRKHPNNTDIEKGISFIKQVVMQG